MVPTSYVWFACATQFRLLVLSVASVLENAGADAPLYVAQDASDRLSPSQISFLASLSPRVHVLAEETLFHMGVSGPDQCHRLCRIHHFVASTSGSLYTTKIDSDCLFFEDTVTRLLAADRFMVVGTWAEWGAWGAYCSYSRHVWSRLAAMPYERYLSLLSSVNDHGSFDEDHVHLRVVDKLWTSSSLLLRRPDWTSGWFDAYQYQHQKTADTLNILEARKKIDFFDVVEFGRRFQMAHLALPTEEAKLKVQERCMRQALELHRSESAHWFWSERAANSAQ